MISGTNGIMGAADTIFVITKDNRNDESAILSITGRDIEENKLSISFNKDTYKWDLIGNEEEVSKQRKREDYERNPLVNAIREILSLSTQNYWKGSSSEFIRACKEHNLSYNAPSSQNLSNQIKRLVPMLNEYDNIYHDILSNGNAGKIHYFSKTNKLKKQ